MLKETLQKENISALKQKNNVIRAILSVVLNKITLLEVEKRSKNEEINDNDITSILLKVLKELEDEKQGYIEVNNQAKVEEIIKQAEFIKQFLPKMLSEQEIIAEINKLEDKSIPNIMKHFKNNYIGQVDMSLVNKLARELNK